MATCDFCGSHSMFEFLVDKINVDYLMSNWDFKNSGYWAMTNYGTSIETEIGCVCPECLGYFYQPKGSEYTDDELRREFPDMVPCIIDGKQHWRLTDVTASNGRCYNFIVALNCRTGKVCVYSFGVNEIIYPVSKLVVTDESPEVHTVKEIRKIVNDFIDYYAKNKI